MKQTTRVRNVRQTFELDVLEERQLLASSALNSAAVPTVAAIYSTLLGRKPDIFANAFTLGLQNGETVAQVTDAVVTSPEYIDKHLIGSPKENASFLVGSLYQDVLGRAPDSVGYGAWLQALTTMSPEKVASSFVNSTEAKTSTTSILYTSSAQAVDSLYTGLLQRKPDIYSNNFIHQLQGGGTIAQVASTVAGSQEYLSNNVTTGATEAANNSQFVTSLYVNVLDRKPDADGLAGWVNVLTTRAMTSSQVATDFVYSPESTQATG